MSFALRGLPGGRERIKVEIWGMILEEPRRTTNTAGQETGSESRGWLHRSEERGGPVRRGRRPADYPVVRSLSVLGQHRESRRRDFLFPLSVSGREGAPPAGNRWGGRGCSIASQRTLSSMTSLKIR